MKAFYFATSEMRLRYGDGRKIEKGITHSVDGEIIPCRNGLHASCRLIDALQYAPGPVLCLVEMTGIVVRGDDKVAASQRTYLEVTDISDVLREFSRKQALVNLYKIKPYCCPYDFATIEQWLQTGEHSLRPAAESAARSVAWSATRSAARSAAESAARSAAWSAARSAAESAARSAAESAAWSAARSAAESAAWSAAESAARSAAWSAANRMLTTMVQEKTGWNF